jgi:hypothetical protein
MLDEDCMEVEKQVVLAARILAVKLDFLPNLDR